jgi:hypothetical protein
MQKLLFKNQTYYALCAFILLGLFGKGVSAQIRPSDLDSLFNYYKALNDAEDREIDFKDSDTTLRLKIIQLGVINASRMKHRRLPVKLDILASRVANKMCAESAENKYVGHWNMSGEKPYHRYGFAGGLDHVAENASGRMALGNYRIQISDSFKLYNMKYLHSLFMKEKAPHDGHKKNCLEKTHNYVGIGFYINETQVRYYEEYIDRYFQFENVPDIVKARENFTFQVITQPNFYLSVVAVFRTASLKKMKPRAIMRRKYYKDFDSKYMILPPWELAKFRRDGVYNLEMSFSKPGIYYIKMYQDKREKTKPVNYTTRGKTEGGGIVIRVVP